MAGGATVGLEVLLRSLVLKMGSGGPRMFLFSACDTANNSVASDQLLSWWTTTLTLLFLYKVQDSDRGFIAADDHGHQGATHLTRSCKSIQTSCTGLAVRPVSSHTEASGSALIVQFSFTLHSTTEELLQALSTSCQYGISEKSLCRH